MTSAPELKEFAGGGKVASVAVATNEKYKDRQGTMQETAHFYRLKFWNRLAEVIMEYGHKGMAISARTIAKQERWEDSQGNKRSAHIFHVKEFDMHRDGKAPPREAPPAAPPRDPAVNPDPFDDGMPF